MNVSDVNMKVENFHHTLRSKLDKHFPTKTVKISTLDKKNGSIQASSHCIDKYSESSIGTDRVRNGEF